MGDVNQDPSMEEILASIKRVIADDGRAAVSTPRPTRARSQPESEPAPAAEPELEDAAPDEDDVLELSDPVRDDDGLASANATVAARQSLATLAAMRQPKGTELQLAQPGDGPLEAVVREMLRPMLKDWLDQRLPEIVEDIVSREVARITGRDL
jgi:cell pole-organizing protein PopZ